LNYVKNNFVFIFFFSSDKLANCENYLNVITNSVADRSFIIDYQKFYPIENDLNILNQMCKNLYPLKSNILLYK